MIPGRARSCTGFWDMCGAFRPRKIRCKRDCDKASCRRLSRVTVHLAGAASRCADYARLPEQYRAAVPLPPRDTVASAVGVGTCHTHQIAQHALLLGLHPCVIEHMPEVRVRIIEREGTEDLIESN